MVYNIQCSQRIHYVTLVGNTAVKSPVRKPQSEENNWILYLDFNYFRVTT